MRYRPADYPFNKRPVGHDPTNYFDLYKDILFSDREYLRTDTSRPLDVAPSSTCLCTQAGTTKPATTTCLPAYGAGSIGTPSKK
jgi:hypothetical protein